MASKRFEGQAETEQDPYADDYFFYRYDIRGSVTNIMDGEGAVVKSYDYDEFGVTTSTGDTFFNEVTFTGSVADASGLLYMNARYYNPTTARFLSQDSYTGSASVPWTQHLYAYCNNNPVNMVDPTGHMAGRPCTININDGGGGLSSYELMECSVAPEDPLEKYSGIRDSIVIKRENEAQFLLNQCEDETIDLISNYDMTGACDMLANQIRIAYFEVYNEEFFATQGQLSFEIQLHIEGYFWARDIQTEYNGQIQTYSCPPIFDLYRELDLARFWIKRETNESREEYILRKCKTIEISLDSKLENFYFYKLH